MTADVRQPDLFDRPRAPDITDGITPEHFPTFLEALREYNRRCAERRETGRWTR